MSKHQTLFDMFLKSTSLYKDEVAFTYKRNGARLKVTYQQLFNDVLLLSKEFRSKGLKKDDKVMFVADNRYEWILSDLALLSIGAVSVPRALETPVDELEYIISHAEATFLIIENRETLSLHTKTLERFSLSHMFVIDEYDSILDEKASISQSDINEFVQLHNERKTQDVFTIIYTSGTTGKPKGVALTHANMLYNVQRVPELLNITKEDVWLSILPPWHVFERGVEYVALSHGCNLVYSNPQTFSKDLEYYKPTLVATVPRVWESIHSKVNSTLEKTPNKAFIFNALVGISKAFKYNQRVLKDQLPRFKKENFLYSMAKKIISLLKLILLSPLYFLAKSKLSSVQEKFGGRLRCAISGGGSLPEYVDEWLDALNVNVINSYGMTECSPSIAGRDPKRNVLGTVGVPLKGTELRIVDDRTQVVGVGVVGEIQLKGPQVIKGYYKGEIENIKSFSADGFLRTGDLGKLTINGELILTGRAKDVIVLSSGENVDPTRIEAAISALPFISDSMLVGQDKKGLGLLIVADFETLKEFVYQRLNVVIDSLEQLTQNGYLLSNLKKEFNAVLHKDHGFKTFEKLQNIHFLEEDFKVGEELTNTLKKKRRVIEKKYKELINDFLK